MNSKIKLYKLASEYIKYIFLLHYDHVHRTIFNSQNIWRTVFKTVTQNVETIKKTHNNMWIAKIFSRREKFVQVLQRGRKREPEVQNSRRERLCEISE